MFLSGIIGLLAAERPVIAFLNKESDGFSLIKKANCGYAAVADSPKRAAEIVKRTYNEKEKLGKLGRSGKRYVLNNFTVDVCIAKLEKLF